MTYQVSKETEKLLEFFNKKAKDKSRPNQLYRGIWDAYQSRVVNIETIKVDCDLYLDLRGFSEDEKISFFQNVSGFGNIKKLSSFPDETFVEAFQILIFDSSDQKIKEISKKLNTLLIKSFRIEGIESIYYLMENTSIADKEEFSQCIYFSELTKEIPQFDLIRASKLLPEKDRKAILNIRKKTGELLNKQLNPDIPTKPENIESINKPIIKLPAPVKTTISPSLPSKNNSTNKADNFLVYDNGLEVPFDYSYELVENDEELLRAIALLENEKILAIDTETTGLDPHTSKVRLIQIASYGHKTIIIDCFKCNPKLIQPLLLNNAIKIFHNAKFDLQFFFSLGLEVNQRLFDTMLGYQLVNAGKIFKASLKDLAKNLLDIDLSKAEQTSDWRKKELSSAQLNYASLDAKILLFLREKIRDSLIKLKLNTTAKIEFDCVLTVAMMEFNGMLLDLGKWDSILEKAKKDKEELDNKLQELLPSEDGTLFRTKLNLNSPKQVLEALNKKGIKCNSTDSKTLKKLLPDYPEIIKPLMEYKQLSKLLSSFGDNLIKKINPLTGRLHGKYTQLGSSAGRFSANNPNLQQIPRGKEVRSCFVASPKYKLVIADYSQIELRIAAELTSDKTMIEAYNNNEDLHRLTASIVLNKPLHEVSKDDRQIAKSANFGLIYGASVNGFRGYAEGNYGISLSEDEANTIMDNFFKSYSGLSQWHKTTKSMFYNGGNINETRTKSGRIRYLKEPSPQQLLNTPVQGLGADIVKLALGKLPSALKGFDAKILATVHDEIVLEAHEDIAEDVSKVLTKTMVEAGEYFLTRVPIEADSNIGNSWADK
ncbi:DNA polymerase (plasmid) [Cyanobacterium sp. IPPAS B-1200]|uniref:DNA polymerase n=1 Tax=Cyanobacterium sp. IPPAS B-1200 TaxID=1562720 RepID=UPI000869F51E|nr:DNA polymerase [Cyanobacterium sp. IPPAS B-1200]OEJ78060.1 hypothetical protein A5482_14470 [Cyanobacterium sp. IPPAS B-1200]